MYVFSSCNYVVDCLLNRLKFNLVCFNLLFSIFNSILSYRVMFGYQLIALLPLMYAVSCAVNVSTIFALTAKKKKNSRKKGIEHEVTRCKSLKHEVFFTLTGCYSFLLGS